jgi:hypothetical protein
MTPEKETRLEGRVDYRWRADRERGFEKATLIYDRQGKLIAVDYQTTTREPTPAMRDDR